MRVVKIKYRNPALDTENSYCINNFLWNKEKVIIINKGKEMLVPKYYCPRHVAQVASHKRAIAKYRAANPLKFIKKNYEKTQKERKKHKEREKKKRVKTNRNYIFTVYVSYNEYKLLWDFLYKEVRSPIHDRKRIQTIEELEAKRLKKVGKNGEK